MSKGLKEYMKSVDSLNAPKFSDKSDFYYPKVKESSGLEAFKYVFPDEGQYTCNEDIKYSKSVLLIENELKTLEIIKKFAKSINLEYIFCDNLVILVIGGDDFEWQYKCSSQEEYELLKEALL